MISNRWLVGMAICLALLCLVDGWTQPRREAVREVEPLFTPFSVEQVARVEVSHPSAPEGQQELHIVRSAGDLWVMENHHGFPVRAKLTESLLQGLATLTTLDLLTEDESSHARYGVGEDQGVRIRVTGQDGRVLADLFQGDLAPGGRARYVRRFDGVGVYRAPHFDQRAPADWAPWADSRWMPLDKDLVQSVRMARGEQGAVTEWKRKPGSRLQWQDQAGQNVARTQVENLLTILSRVTLREVRGPGLAPWSSDPGSLRLELELAGGMVWKGQLSPETLGQDAQDASGSPVSAIVERHGAFRVGLAPKAVGALRAALRDALGQ